MAEIIFELASSTTDDEAGLASGWNDPRLSPLGLEQSRDLAARYSANPPDVVFCSDLKRAVQSANLAFGFSPSLIYCDWRLRDLNWGETNGTVLSEALTRAAAAPETAFEGGESPEQMIRRVGGALADIKAGFSSSRVIVIGHPTTKRALDYWLSGLPAATALAQPLEWQPGWTYQIK